MWQVSEILKGLIYVIVIIINIDDVTSVYLQQTQGIGLSIHLNEPLHYSMAHYMACVSWREF